MQPDYDPTTALIVVDVPNDFADPAGSLCVAGGDAFHPALTADAGPSVRKGENGEDGYSGFTMRDPLTGATVPTELDGLLRGRGVRRVVVCGLATDYCVRGTALDATALGYRTSVLVEGVRAVDVRPGDGAAALAALVDAGVELVEPSIAAPAEETAEGVVEEVAP
jgi:nicotinamidase/pyrazinamidase